MGGGGDLIMVMSTDACWGGHFCVEPDIFVSNRAFFYVEPCILLSNRAFFVSNECYNRS